MKRTFQRTAVVSAIAAALPCALWPGPGAAAYDYEFSGSGYRSVAAAAGLFGGGLAGLIGLAYRHRRQQKDRRML